MRRVAHVLAVLAAAASILACTVTQSGQGSSTPALDATSTRPGAMRYVALGDSYTIGTAVGPEARFPEQLAAAMAGRLELVANLGVNGYTSADLIRTELPALDGLGPDIVTVLIGVNDIVQGVSASDYEAHVETILDALLKRLPPTRIVTVAIPDYTVTPAGSDYGDPVVQSGAIRAANATTARLAARRNIAFVDIYPISREAATDPTLVADDGLHPSGAQYARWVELLMPVIQLALRP